MTISLRQQIEEVAREIALRENVYPRQVASGRMRQSIADFHMERIRAVKQTLGWLAENEARIKEVLGSKAA